MNALTWAVLLAVTLPRTGDKPARILLPADSKAWVCATYTYGVSCKTVADVRDYILTNAGSDDGLE